MSPGELVGLLATVALFAAVVGVVLTAVVSWRRNRRIERWIRQTDAYGQWLGAYLTLIRASISFVAAFRSLAAQKHDSKYFSLRGDEAKRARADWCEAKSRLDRAEAMLIAWSDDASIAEQLAGFRPGAPDMLRAAIDGDPSDVEQLTRRLRETEQRAIAFVRTATDGEEARRFPFSQCLSRPARWATIVMDNWAKRP